MSLGIKYNGDFFDLVPNQSIEIERFNPMFMFESYTGEYSSQIIFLASEKNRRMIGNELFFELSSKGQLKLLVEVYDGETFTYNATVILRSNYTHRIFENKGNIQGNLLFGFSRFFNDIKDKKATSLYLGGEITKTFTTLVVDDNTGGYWQHFYDTRLNADNYLVAPIVNDSDDENSIYDLYGFLNPLDNNAMLQTNWFVHIFPRVSYILEQILFEFGWKIDSSLLNGTEWENLFYPSFKIFQFFDVTWTDYFEGGVYINVPSFTPKSAIIYRIADAFSNEVTIEELFFETCKKYGWIPIFDDAKNVCKIYPLKNCINFETIDYTEFAAKDFTSDFGEKVKRTSFKNIFPSNDTLPSTPDFSNKVKETPVVAKADLPTPLGNYDNSIIYVYNENKYYEIQLDEITNKRFWGVFADNIYDEIAKDETEVIETKITTLPIYKTKYRTQGGVDYYGYFAWAKQELNKDFGIRILYYHGMVREILEDGTPGIERYPYLSSIRTLPNGDDNASWSNVLTHVKAGVDYGIINYWFKNWMDFTASIEDTEQKIWLPFYKAKTIDFAKRIMLFQIPHLLRSYVEPIPYNGFVLAKTLCLQQGKPTVVVSRKVYLNLRWESTQNGDDIYIYGQIFSDNVIKSKPVVYVYADAALTIPLNVINLTVKLKATTGAENSGVSSPMFPYADYKQAITGNKKEICTSIIQVVSAGYYDINVMAAGGFYNIKQHLISAPSTDFLLSGFILDTSPDYEIIP